MFKIYWRKKMECDPYRRIYSLVEGLSKFKTFGLAQEQAEIFQKHFPQNNYYIHKV